MTQKTKRSGKAAGPPEIPAIKVSGDFAGRISVINATPMSLLIGLGEVDSSQEEVLVPLVNISILGSDDDGKSDGKRIFSTTLTLENAAFVAGDVADELRDVVGQITKLSAKGLYPEKARLQAVNGFLASARMAIEDCQRQIDSILLSSNAAKPG